MKDDVIKRLETLGYAATASDDWILDFSIAKVRNTIKNECNVDITPDGLNQISVDMACGEFLLIKRRSGQLDGTTINLEAAVKQIKEGDTSITYAISDDTVATIDGLIQFLLTYGKPQFLRFRRFAW